MKSLQTIRTAVRHLLLAGVLLLSACASVCETGACATQSVERRARQEHFTAKIIEGKGFTHQVFWRKPPAIDSEALWIFIEGDGNPWIGDGRVINDDPSPRFPLALQLAAQTRGAVLYLGRPCYFKARGDARCSSELWTSDRFSSAVVASMNEALRSMLAQLNTQRFVLVGHSGGGTLAALMANDLVSEDQPPAAVVTIAANLDVEAWTSHHGYLPLTGSRNPALEPSLPAAIEQFHLVGAKDTNVTPRMNTRYLDRVPADRIWREARFDHDCCWSLDWPRLQKRLLLTAPSVAGN